MKHLRNTSKWSSYIALATTLCLLGCSSVKAPVLQYHISEVPKSIILDASENHPRSILLEENGTTGYLWAAFFDKESCQVKVEHLSPVDNGMVGVPGQARVTLTPLGKKETVVTLKYMRSWEPNTPAKTFEIVIRSN